MNMNYITYPSLKKIDSSIFNISKYEAEMYVDKYSAIFPEIPFKKYHRFFVNQWKSILGMSLKKISGELAFKEIAKIIDKKTNEIKKRHDLNERYDKLDNKKLIKATRFYFDLSHLCILARLKFVTAKSNQMLIYNDNYIIENLNKRTKLANTICISMSKEINKRILNLPLKDTRQLYNRLPIIESSYLAFGGKKLKNFLYDRANNATVGLYLPGESQAQYNKLRTNTGSEMELYSILEDHLYKLWSKIMKEGKFTDALLGDDKAVYGFKNNLRKKFIAKIESNQAKKQGCTIRELRDERRNKKQDIVYKDIFTPIYQDDEKTEEVYYTSENFSTAKQTLFDIFDREERGLRYNAFASKKIISTIKQELNNNNLDLDSRNIAEKASVSYKTVRYLYKKITDSSPNLSTFLN